MADKYKITASVNGFVQINVPDEFYEDNDAFEMAQLLVATAYKARALQEVDRVMDEHRRRFGGAGFAVQQPEYALVDRIWRDLRLAFGLDDGQKAGGQ